MGTLRIAVLAIVFVVLLRRRGSAPLPNVATLDGLAASSAP